MDFKENGNTISPNKELPRISGAEAVIRSLLAEGVDTSKAMYKLSTDYNVDLPISTAIYKMLFESKDPRKELEALFDREIKFEF